MTNNDSMTIQEISVLLGKSRDAVFKIINRIIEKNDDEFSTVLELKLRDAKKSHPASFTFNEVEYILKQYNPALLPLINRPVEISTFVNINEVKRYFNTINYRINNFSVLVAQTQSDLRDVMNEIESFKKQHRLELPAPLPEKNDRATLNQIVRNYSNQAGAEIQSCWAQLYREYYYRYHHNLTHIAKARGLKPIEYAEIAGFLKNLIMLAEELFTNKKEVVA